MIERIDQSELNRAIEAASCAVLGYALDPFHTTACFRCPQCLTRRAYEWEDRWRCSECRKIASKSVLALEILSDHRAAGRLVRWHRGGLHVV